MSWWAELLFFLVCIVVASRMWYCIGHTDGRDFQRQRELGQRPVDTKPIECVHLWAKWERITMRDNDSRKVDGLQRACDSCGDLQRKPLVALEIAPISPKMLRDNLRGIIRDVSNRGY